MQNHLINQTSPYLLQHAANPVDWYPWGEEAFQRAKTEDKPIFLSIGYSTCHWCHVMAHESFEDAEVAELLNRNFISIKVDKEERPDIDSIYMSVCQSLTGSGGWPTSIFMTAEQKPFFAGTYFPKHPCFGSIGFIDLLTTIRQKWNTDRTTLLNASDKILHFLKESQVQNSDSSDSHKPLYADFAEQFMHHAVEFYRKTFDKTYGGFGNAPKFPSPHNLLFLMEYARRTDDDSIRKMTDKTLLQMYRGGIFDHIGGGFSRYSTDERFLIPHFEKMLYDNALLILAYTKGYEMTGNVLYQGVAEKTGDFILKEMTSPRGGFYSAQDADSDGVEGKYYLLEPTEIHKLLGVKDGEAFCRYFDITKEGNFEGKNIPNLLNNQHITSEYNVFLPIIYEYRKKRYDLHLDDKILTSWNGLMIAAMCSLYRITGNERYLGAAEQAQNFIEKKLYKEDSLFISWREGQCSGQGILDDYANEIFALICLYETTFDRHYLKLAQDFCQKVIQDFYDSDNGGFFLTGKESESLILRPKETYDGAIPSGNSMMAYNMVRLYHLGEACFSEEFLQQHLQFLLSKAIHYPVGYGMFLTALLDYVRVPDKVSIVLKDKKDLTNLACRIPLHTIVHVFEQPTAEYPLLNDKTTYYVCRDCHCLPASNELKF